VETDNRKLFTVRLLVSVSHTLLLLFASSFFAYLLRKGRQEKPEQPSFTEVSPDHEQRVEYQQRASYPNSGSQNMGDILVANHLGKGGDETTVFMPGFESLLEKKHYEYAEAIQAGAHGHMGQRGPIPSQGSERHFLQHEHDLGDDQRADERNRQAVELDVVFREDKPLENQHHEKLRCKKERGQPHRSDLVAQFRRKTHGEFLRRLSAAPDLDTCFVHNSPGALLYAQSSLLTMIRGISATCVTAPKPSAKPATP
jgi:hypothetical protein